MYRIKDAITLIMSNNSGVLYNLLGDFLDSLPLKQQRSTIPRNWWFSIEMKLWWKT